MIDRIICFLFDLLEIFVPVAVFVLFVVMMMRPVHGV